MILIINCFLNLNVNYDWAKKAALLGLFVMAAAVNECVIYCHFGMFGMLP
jgi:hypothetical protein